MWEIEENNNNRFNQKINFELRNQIKQFSPKFDKKEADK